MQLKFSRIQAITVGAARVESQEDGVHFYRFPTSAIKLGGQKINYYDFLMSGQYADCNEAILRIVPKIDMEQIEQFIEETPYISDLQKDFYKAYINARYEKIMLPAFEQAEQLF